MAVGSKEFINQTNEHTPVQVTIFEDKPDPVYRYPIYEASVAVESMNNYTCMFSKSCWLFCL